MDLPKQDTRCVDAEGRARRFGAKIGREHVGQFVKKLKKPQNTSFGPIPLFAKQLGLESIRGENLEFFQLKPPLKLFSPGTF